MPPIAPGLRMLLFFDRRKIPDRWFAQETGTARPPWQSINAPGVGVCTPMIFAEEAAEPMEGELLNSIKSFNDLNEYFILRPGRIRFQVKGTPDTNLKVILKIHRQDGICETFIIDTDCYEVRPQGHRRVTRNFFIHPNPLHLGRIDCVKFSYVIHLGERSFCSRYEYIFMDREPFDEDRYLWRRITARWVTINTYRTFEVDAAILQRDVDWYNHHFDALNMVPKFTNGRCHHPYHPKRYIHDRIDELIHARRQRPEERQGLKVCVDCIDDTDFITHLLFAHHCGVKIQCIIDWRKMTLTNSDNYRRLKKSGIELLGVFCSSNHSYVEVAPDMHNKFIIFGDTDAIVGSFNITFDRWGANWESGATFHSQGICRLLDNIFQSIRGGLIQKYGVDPCSPFNLLYTFGRHKMMNGCNFRPHQAIISAIHRARNSIMACLFLIGEMRGDHGDSVIDALIHAKHRGVRVELIFNGHIARVGDTGRPFTMAEELRRPLLPAIERLRCAGIPISLAYGINDHAIPYSPLHSKYCIIDQHIVIDGSFNWYNTSVYSHDHLTVVDNREIAEYYRREFHETQNSLRVFRC